MYIENIKLKNFTTFRDCKIDFSNGVNIIIGENATGKTHLLKAIYCLNPSFYIKYQNKVYKSNIPSTEYPFNSPTTILNKYEYNTIKDKIKDLEIKISSFLLKDKKNINIKKELNKYLTELNQLTNSCYLKFNNYIEIKLQIDKLKIIKSVNDINHIFYLYDKTNLKDRETLFDDDKYLFNDKKFTYIPCKDIMTNSKGFTSLYEKREISFESIYNDILNKAYLPQLRERELKESFINITKKIENAIGGIVVQHNELFFIEYKDFGEIEFTMVAEGHKKLALLWLLIKNGEIDENTILLFDEPESNLNPKLTDVLVDILLSLSRLGVQIFIATHNNFIIDEFELQRNKNDNIKFHSFYFEYSKSKGVLVDSNEYIDKIKHNAIENKFKEQHYSSIKKAFEK